MEELRDPEKSVLIESRNIYKIREAGSPNRHINFIYLEMISQLTKSQEQIKFI